MYNFVNYPIKRGDNLYEIAKKYNTTVEKLMEVNPNINPYDLLIGSYIKIPINNSMDLKEDTLKEKMRTVWEQHVFWTRLVIISILEHLNDEKDTTDRLLRNAKDLAFLFEPYYGSQVANSIDRLITDHLVIASKLIHAIDDNQAEDVARLNQEWYANADEIATALSNINPNYEKEMVRRMFHEHLNLIKEEVMNRIQKNYKNEINIFDLLEKQAITMADYFTKGITKQLNV